MRVTVLVNVLTSVNSFCYQDHVNFFTKTIRDYGNDIEVVFFTPNRFSIDNARNQAAKFALENRSDYLMFIDDDVMVPSGCLKELVSHDKDIIAGNVIIRGFPFHLMLFKWRKGKLGEADFDGLTYFNDLLKTDGTRLGDLEEVKDVHDLVRLQECAATGFSCCLIKCSLLSKIRPPYFVTGKYNTEDVYFCMKAIETAMIRNEPWPSIYVDTWMECGHLLNPEPISIKNRRGHLYEYYKEIDAMLKEGQEDGRSASYIERMLSTL